MNDQRDIRIAELEARVAELQLALGIRDNAPSALCLALGITPFQAAILGHLWAAKGEWVSSGHLIDGVPPKDPWKLRDDEGTLRVQVCKLRKRIGYDKIDSRWGSGYRLSPAGVSLCEEALSGPRQVGRAA